MGKNAPFEKFRTEDMFGFLRISIPECWPCILDERGIYGCYEEDVETGTLWVEHRLIKIGKNTDTKEDVGIDALSEMVEPDLIEPFFDTRPNAVRTESWKLGSGDFLGYSIFHAPDDDGDKTPLTFYRWQFIRVYNDGYLLLYFTFVIPSELDLQENFIYLTEAMEKNILKMEIMDGRGLEFLSNIGAEN